MLPNKSIKFWCNLLLGPLLFGWLVFSIVQQVSRQAHLAVAWLQVRQSLGSVYVFLLVGAALLIGCNWGLEARKWQVSMAGITPVSFAKAFRAVLSGISFAVTTPNRMGEYVGRMLYLPEGHRLESIAITVVGSISQLLVTLWAGWIGLLLLQPYLTEGALLSVLVFRAAAWGIGVGGLLLTVFYFETGLIGRWLDKLLRRTRYRFLIAALRGCSRRMLLHLLLLSVGRYGVFIVQYLLVFRFFGVEVAPLVLAAAVAVLFLAIAVIPSVALAEVGLRGQLSLALVGLFSANSLGIALTSVTVWLFNLVLPALAGSVLILGLRLFTTKSTNEIITPPAAGLSGDICPPGTNPG